MSIKQKTLNKNKLTKLLLISTHLGAIIPGLILIIKAFMGDLGFNSIQTATHWTGRIALTLLLLSLTVTPIKRIFDFTAINKVRRPLGLYAFLYASIHLGIFIALDYGFDWDSILQSILQNRFILIGSIALIILLILAITSYKPLINKLGRGWKWIHRAVYLAAILILLHFAWAGKGDIFSLQGNIVEPLIATGALLLLFVLRIPFVTKGLRKLIGNG
ncbi:MAG: ferric reductase-like transmembrane domain-containing protein [Anaerolineaceae bacterium]|nr:ferric reductase-like transmembrane domain-containing protein [Anaerolineaceae bacterium]